MHRSFRINDGVGNVNGNKILEAFPMIWKSAGSLERGTERGRIRSLIPSHGAGGDMGCDRCHGGMGEDPEAAYRRDNPKNMRAWRAIGNIKKRAAVADIFGKIYIRLQLNL